SAISGKAGAAPPARGPDRIVAGAGCTLLGRVIAELFFMNKPTDRVFAAQTPSPWGAESFHIPWGKVDSLHPPIRRDRWGGGSVYWWGVLPTGGAPSHRKEGLS